MSDHIEVDGRKYYEESYVILANNNGKRRGERIKELEAAIERDRSKMADIVTAVQKELDSRFWLTEGRGSYEWDDDRYRQEFHGAAVAIIKALDPLKALAADLTDSPRASAEVIAARRDIAAENAELRRVVNANAGLDFMLDKVAVAGAVKFSEALDKAAATLAELRQDRARLEFLLSHPCYLAYSNDGDDCWLHWAWDPQDEERQPWNDPKANSPRHAIDLAMAAESKPGTEGK